MALPSYVSTEWTGLGHATLRFRPKKVPVVEPPKASEDQEGEKVEEDSATPDQDSWWWWLPGSWWGGGIPWFSTPKEAKPQFQPIKTHAIECYLSAVYIGEYGERKSKASKGGKSRSEHQECVEEEPASNTHQADVCGQNAASDNSLTHLEDDKDDLRPPGIESEVWSAWLMYWEAWKDVLIPLSWVHKYREHCTPEFITWYDSYVQDYPEVLPWITEELGVSELLEDTTGTSNLENGGGDSVETNVCEGKTVGTNVCEGREAAGTDKCEGEAVGTSVCEGKAAEGEDNSSDSEFDMTEFFDFLNGDIDSVGENAEVIVKDTESGKEDKSVSSTSKETGETRGGVSILVLDDLYTKHTKKRYLVHLRTFLHSSEVESSQDLDTFFKTEAGIDFNLQTATVEDETNTTRQSDDTGHSHSIKNKGELKSQKQTKDTRKETLENGTGAYQPECSPITQDHNDREGCDAVLCEERTVPHVSEVTGGVVECSGGEESTQGQAGGAVGVNVSASQEHKTSKRRRKGDNVKSQGTSWALKYVQGKTATQSEASQPNERPPVSPELHGAVPGTSVAPEPPETAPGALEVARTGEKGVVYTEEEEADAVQAFFDELNESDRIFWKKYNKRQVEKAVLEALNEPHTRLQRLLVDCRAFLGRAAEVVHDVFLPFTILHFLNVALPGTAVIEYESSVTEEVPGERERLKSKFDEFIYLQRRNLECKFPPIANFSIRIFKDVVVPVTAIHLIKWVLGTLEMKYQFPPTVFGVQWLPLPAPSVSGDGKNIKRQQRRLHRFLEEQDPNVSPSCTVNLIGKVMHRVNAEPDSRTPQRWYQEVVKEEGSVQEGKPHLTARVLHLGKGGEGKSGGSGACGEVEWQAAQITFDKDGNFCVAKEDPSTASQTQESESEEEVWERIISGCQRLSYWVKGGSLPSDLPKDIEKYWAQRYRLFLNFDQGIRLDNESWYSVTPEFLAAHQAWRCRSAVAVDAMCGAGGNAIQLAKTCGRVIAIDKDPKKVELARHNAQVYGVADRIDFRVGDFFKLASSLKADVVYLSPPWGGVKYLEEEVYNVYRLGGTMNCARLMRAARSITHNVALFLPRNSDVCQVIELAGVDGTVDVETAYMGHKKKAITAYFGDLAVKCFCPNYRSKINWLN